jgi:hypothetical protein
MGKSCGLTVARLILLRRTIAGCFPKWNPSASSHASGALRKECEMKPIEAQAETQRASAESMAV